MAISIRRPTINLKLFKSDKAAQIPKKLHAYFLKTLAELLMEGFSLQQSLQFMQVLMPKHVPAIQHVVDELATGKTFEKAIQPLGYSITVVAQLFYAQRQGRFHAALLAAGEQLQMMNDYKLQLIKTLAYPMLMSLFLGGLLFGMRSFTLPHMTSFISQEMYDQNVLIQILINFFSYLPQIGLGILIVCLFIYLFIDFYFMRLPYLRRYQFLVRIPLIRKWSFSYCSYLISRELGYFFEGGYSILQTVEVLTAYPIDPFLSEIATYFNQQMKEGVELPQIINDLGIFTAELPHVIHQGELTSQMAQKCKIYSQKVFKDLLADINRTMGYIQPVLFILIAILVMSMYLMMMLPMLTMEI